MNTYLSKVIVITGASDGIGAELACQLAIEKPCLVLAARNANALETVAARCRLAGAEVLVVPTDVGESQQCKQLIESTVKHFGAIHVLINNVGVSTHASLEDAVDHGMFEKVLRVNLFGSVWCTRMALPYLRASGGQILAVCSLAGRIGIAHRSAYCTSKFAQDGFFQALRVELRDSGVGITIAYPGFVATGFDSHSLDVHGQPFGRSVVRSDRSMPVDICANKIIAALRKREPEIVMTSVGKIALWLKLISPKIVDRLSRATVKKAKN